MKIKKFVVLILTELCWLTWASLVTASFVGVFLFSIAFIWSGIMVALKLVITCILVFIFLLIVGALFVE